jgi:hypothetical protein
VTHGLIRLLPALVAAWPALAQFGGQEGDAVFLVISHHGAAAVQTAAAGAQNPAAALAGFKVTDVGSLPFEDVVPGIEARKTQVARRDADDRFEVITQAERIPVPPTLILTRSKVFTLDGLIDNANTGGKDRIYLIGGALVPFTSGVTIAREVSLIEFRAVFWRPEAAGLPFEESAPDYVGPAVPPGQTGLEYQQDRSKVGIFLPWTQVRKTAGDSRWPAGIELKLLEEDTTIPSTIQLLRVRKGRRSPVFRFPSRTHLYLLQGSADIAPVGGATNHMTSNWHAYLPAGIWFSLSNPVSYDGPGIPGGTH